MQFNQLNKSLCCAAFAVFFLFVLPSLRPLAAQPVRTAPDNTLLLAPVEVSAEAISLPFDIPFAGMIIVEVYDEDGERLFRKQQTRDSGHHTFSFKPDNFKVGKTYTFHLEYKGNIYSGEIARN